MEILVVSSDACNWTSHGEPWHIYRQDINIRKEKVEIGSYSVVTEGVYKETTTVAVKLALIKKRAEKPDFVKVESDFLKEIKLWYSLSHPNVVQFVGAYIGPGHWMIASTFQRGGSLRAYLSRHQQRGLKLPATVVNSMALDIARGMEYLHQKGIMHRDLKSANLLLDESGVVKVADFGLARYEPKGGEDVSMEAGTIAWMAPEMILHMGYTRKVDVYSYGIVLSELCTSLVPYEGLTVQQIVKHVSKDHGRPPTADVHPPFAKLMSQCWDGDTMKRPEFSEIVKYLERKAMDDTEDVQKLRTNQEISRVKEIEPATMDASSRLPTSVERGRVSTGGRNTGLSSSTLRRADETPVDGEESVSTRKRCTCSIM